ncbi:MAG: dipeptidase [Proteobacteria bacterium]|jgi:acetylornithine deacetylase/succinyl-diaminopimelate desuccinylase-like protein|nr:dipeptidase [Pseudomonadota bacterium]
MTETDDAVARWLDSSFDRLVAELGEWLAIPSVSADPERRGDLVRAAEWLAARLRRVGVANAEVVRTCGHPIVRGDWLGAGADRPTVICYGHYDVQPAGPLEAWSAPPFEARVRRTERGDDLFARGAADDKGQIAIQLAAVEALLATLGRLPVNVRFLYEGEEEVGSGALARWVGENAAGLGADAVLVSDTAIAAPDRPSVDCGLRGIWAGELVVRGPARDLHSGAYGGVVMNPLHALAEIVASFHDASGRVAVEGFYDGVRELPAAERAELGRLGIDDARILRETGAPAAFGEPGFSPAERIGARPTLDVIGMWGGVLGAAFQGIIPAEARAKITCRLVPAQEPEHVGRCLAAHVAKRAPSAVTVELSERARLAATLLEGDSPAFGAASRAFERGFGVRPLRSLCGGGIPIVGVLVEALGAPAVLMGFALPDDGAHGPDERLSLGCFRKGVKTVAAFFEELEG